MRRVLIMTTLVFAGEIIFGLPFHTARFYRPTLLEAFNFTNTQLGDVFAVYGVTAMIALAALGVVAWLLHLQRRDGGWPRDPA